MSGPDFATCDAESVGDLSPCPLEKGHDGLHYFYQQTAWDEDNPDGTWGINVFDENGEAVCNLEVKGEFEHLEVAAVLWIFKLNKEKK